jgi:hypothetical protein
MFKFALYTAMVGSLWAGSTTIEVDRVPLDDRGLPPITSTTEIMLDSHDCWTGDAPAGIIPSHVVVTLPGHVEPTYGGRKLTTAALNHLFADGPTVGDVHGFCR